MTWNDDRRGSQIPQPLRRRIFARDNNECQIKYRDICTGKAEHVDHIVNLASQGLPRGHNDPDNLQAVCGPCHRRKTGKEGRQAQLDRQAKATKRRRNMNRPVGLDPNVDYELPEPPGIRLQRERAEQRRLERKARMAEEDAEARRLAAEFNDEQP